MACPVATIENLALCQGWQVGLGKVVKIGLPADFTAVPTPPLLTNLITNEAYATAVGTFTAAEGKGFITAEIDSTQKQELKVDIDENAAVSVVFKARIGFSKDALGFIKKLMPRKRVLLALDKPNGETILVGYKGFEATIMKWTITEGEDSSIADVEIKCNVMPLIYTGTSLPVQA